MENTIRVKPLEWMNRFERKFVSREVRLLRHPLRSLAVRQLQRLGLDGLRRGDLAVSPRRIRRGGKGRMRGAGADWVLTRPQRVGGAPSLRPVEPGSFPLAHGAPARVVRLRGYGDGIVAPQAAAFIEAVMEEMEERSKQCLNK